MEMSHQNLNATFWGALSRVVLGNFAVIEFDMESRITRANDLFLQAMGYRQEELLHQRHQMFMPPDEVGSTDYSMFWNDLRAGKAFNGRFRRVNARGKMIWLDACYGPLFDADGHQYGVVKVAIDASSHVQSRNALDIALTELGSNDLTVRIKDHIDDEFEPIRAKFNETIGNLHAFVSSIGRSSKQISGLSEETREKSDKLRDDCNLILQDVDTSIDNLSAFASAFSKVRDEAVVAQSVIDRVSQTSRNGSEVVDSVVASIRSVNEVMEKVTNATNVIQGFARQTNLLGINAAVEAARVGQLGAGFSVVASEVRALSERSSAASREIADLIQQSREEVAKGVKQADAAGNALSEIDKSVKEAVGAISEISSSVSGQLGVVSDLQNRLKHVQKRTQNAKLTAETTAQSSTKVVVETKDMSTQASIFRL